MIQILITPSIVFLGESQTFLGVLATIIILFIIANNSNLIHEILKEVKDKIKDTVQHLQVNTDMSGLLESAEFKCVCMYQEKENSDATLKAQASKWIANVLASRSELQTKYAAVEFNEDILLKKIEESKEQSLAPLFSFAFCLVLFVFDELLRSSSIECDDFLLSALSVFILLSYLFWIVLWLNFIRYMRYNLNQMLQLEPHCDTFIMRVVSYFNGFKQPYQKYIEDVSHSSRKVLALFFFRAMMLLLVCMAILLIHTYWYYVGPIVLIIVGVAAPVVVIGLTRLWIVFDYGKLSYVFLCGHIVTLFIVSLIISAVIVYMSCFLGITDEMLLPYSNTILKISSFSFIILNGILLPLLLPYYCYNLYYRKAKKKVRDSEKEAQAIVDDLKNKIVEFSHTIPPPFKY